MNQSRQQFLKMSRLGALASRTGTYDQAYLKKVRKI
jgi:hypothetical protein